MKKALIVVDYTYDFVADDGKLTCGKPGQAIAQTIANYMKQFIDEGQFVFIANDLHHENDPYHPETKLFPPHNIIHTAGRNLYGAVKDMYDAHAHLQTVISFDKTRYSSFAGTNLHQLLQERQVNDITIVGVCTDICILHTAVDGYNLGYRLTIPKDGVASFNAQGHAWALTHFSNCLGANVI